MRGRMDQPRARAELPARSRPAGAAGEWAARIASANPWLLAAGALLALRLGLALALLYTGLVEHNRWYFPNDDQVLYFGVARGLVEGYLADTYTTIGYGVVLAPFAVTSDFVLQAVPAVAIVQFLLALPAAWLLYRAGARLMDRRSAALGTLVWLALPILLGPLFVPSYHRPFELSPYWLGLVLSADYASALFAVAVLYLASGARTDASARRGLAVGAVAGLAFLLKPSNVVLLGAALLALAAWRRWRAALVALAAMLAVFSPQLVHNHRLYGRFTSFGYGRDPQSFEETSLTYIPRVFGKLIVSNWTGPLVLLACALALVLTWRRYRDARWLVVAQVVGFALFFASLYFSIGPTFLRYLTVAFPALALAFGAALAGKAPGHPDEARSTGSLGTALAGATVAGAVALSVWAGGARIGDVRPTVEEMAPVATVSGEEVRLRWREPSAPADLTYQVTRRPARGGEGDETVATVSGTSAVDRPGPGAWEYRVAIAPFRRRDGWTPSVVMAFSPTVPAIVPAG